MYLTAFHWISYCRCDTWDLLLPWDPGLGKAYLYPGRRSACWRQRESGTATVKRVHSSHSARSFWSLLCIIWDLHGFEHFLHRELVLGLFVLDFPHLAEPAFADYVLIPEQVLFYLRVVWDFGCKFGELAGPVDLTAGGDSLLEILLLPLVGEVLGVLKFKLGLFLRFHHIIIIEFLVDALDVDLREVHLRWFLEELIDGALLAGDKPLIIEGFFALLEEDGFLGVAIGFDFGSCLVEMVVNLFVNDGVSKACFFVGFSHSCFL